MDFIATEFSQMETNRFFWIISDDPNLGEEPEKFDYGSNADQFPLSEKGIRIFLLKI